MEAPTPIAPSATARTLGPGLLYGAAGALLLLSVAWTSASRIDEPFAGFLVWDNGVLQALYVEAWTGPSADLPLNGGIVIGVGDRSFAGGRELQRQVAAVPVGTPLRYSVRAGGELRDYAVATMRMSAFDYFRTLGGYLLLSAFLLAVGAVALAVRPDHAQARSLALSFGLMGVAAALTVDHVTRHGLPLCQVAEIGLPAALLHLALIFPVARLEAASRRALSGAAAGVCLLAAALNLYWFESDPELARKLLMGAYVATVVIVAGIFASVAHAVWAAREPRARMQAAVVLAALLPGAVLPAAAIAAFSLLGWTFSWTWALAGMPLLATGFLYAVMRHDLFQAERFVRLTIGYSAVSTAAVLGYGVGLALVQRLLAPGAVPQSAATFTFLVAVVLLAEPLRRKVQVGIDRAFFRTRADFAQVLEDSGAALARLRDREEIRRAVTRRLTRALALDWAELRLGAEAGARPAELEEPLVFENAQLGRIACGPKGSGAPFSEGERELVRGIAAQAALAVQKADALDELARAQQALLRAERLAAVGEFANVVAHGLRNPLAGIRTTAQLAHREAVGATVGEATGDALASVLSEVDRLDHRIRTLLDFSRPYAPRREEADLAALLHAVARAVDVQARGAGTDVVLDLPQSTVVREVDAVYLEEALLELAANGLRAMPDGGKLTLALREDATGVEIVVTDTGPGIPEGTRERIFDLFFTSREDGTGVGLASVRKIVESHGGSIDVAATGPQGTSFRLHLP